MTFRHDLCLGAIDVIRHGIGLETGGDVGVRVEIKGQCEIVDLC